MTEITKIKGRRASRQLALQGLYAWQFSHAPLSQIKLDLQTKTPSGFLQDGEDFAEIFANSDRQYCLELIDGVGANCEFLDTCIEKFIDRNITKLNAVELTILRLGIFELQNMRDVPTRVVINEAVELAKQFGAQDGYKFVNGVLDKAAKEYRTN